MLFWLLFLYYYYTVKIINKYIVRITRKEIKLVFQIAVYYLLFNNISIYRVSTFLSDRMTFDGHFWQYKHELINCRIIN